MKSSFYKTVLILCIVSCLIFTGCSSDELQEASKQTEADLLTEETHNESVSGFIVDKTIYENENYTLICKRILSSGIEFECTNSTDEDISLFLTIGLDGTVAELWADGYDMEIAAGETKSFTMHGLVESIEHEMMSVNGVIFSNSDYSEFDVCDVELGGVHNSVELVSGEVVYSTSGLVVEYLGADAQGVNYKVINNRTSSITFGAESFTINGDDTDYAITVTTIPGHTQGTYSIDILSYNENYFSNELASFEGILFADVSGEGVVDRFPVSYGSNESAESSEPVEPTEQVTISSGVYDAYITATTLTKKDLTKENSATGTKYYYEDLPLLSEDVEWIENSINKKGTVNQGAIYRKLAKLLEGYAIHLNNGSSYSKYIFGSTLSTEEFAQYADVVSEFITSEDSLYHVLKKFESLECVEGEFDYGNNYWAFTIADLTQCAEEMQISEEMLGYIFAMLDEYAPTITFDGNSCTFEYESMFDFDFES